MVHFMALHKWSSRRQFLAVSFALYWFVIKCLGADTTSTGCPAEFLGRCRCGRLNLTADAVRGLQTPDTFEWYVTNCTNAGFTDPSVLKQLPPETEVLVFVGNDLRRIPPNVFGDEARYDRLVHIDLSRNNLIEIQGQAFHRVPRVKRLFLNDNAWRIDVNHTRIFANMKELDELHLDRALDLSRRRHVDEQMDGSGGGDGLAYLVRLLRGSFITKLFVGGNHIGPYLKMDVFCDILTLAEIHLQRNDIVQVVWERECLSRLHTLDLSNNLLRFLSNSTMNKLDIIADVSLDLSDNDFDCDCRIIPFYKWIHTTHVHVLGREDFTCKDGFPESNAGYRLMALPPDRFRCQEPNLLLLAPSFAVVHVLLALVVVLACAVLLVVAIAHRNSIANTFRIVGEPVYRRIEYSTIQKHVELEV